MAYIQQFSFVIKHESGALNKVLVDAVSRKATLVTIMRMKVLGFDLFKGSISTVTYFSPIISDAAAGCQNDFFLYDGFLFKGNQLCIPSGSMQLKII